MTIHRIRLSKMQKVVNVLAVASAAVSLAVVGTAGYVFVNKDAIIKVSLTRQWNQYLVVD